MSSPATDAQVDEVYARFKTYGDLHEHLKTSCNQYSSLTLISILGDFFLPKKKRTNLKFI